MIDNRDHVDRLLDKLKKSLPLPTRVPPDLALLRMSVAGEHCSALTKSIKSLRRGLRRVSSVGPYC